MRLSKQKQKCCLFNILCPVLCLKSDEVDTFLPNAQLFIFFVDVVCKIMHHSRGKINHETWYVLHCIRHQKIIENAFFVLCPLFYFFVIFSIVRFFLITLSSLVQSRSSIFVVNFLTYTVVSSLHLESHFVEGWGLSSVEGGQPSSMSSSHVTHFSLLLSSCPATVQLGNVMWALYI